VLTSTQACLLVGNALQAYVTGYSSISGLGLDSAGNAYVSAAGSNALLYLTNTRTAISGMALLTTSTLSTPYQLSVDPRPAYGYVYISNWGAGTISRYINQTRTIATFVSCPTYPAASVVDTSGNLFVYMYSTNYIYQYSSAGGLMSSSYGGTSFSCNNYCGMAIDSNNVLYFVSSYGNPSYLTTIGDSGNGQLAVNYRTTLPYYARGLAIGPLNTLFAIDYAYSAINTVGASGVLSANLVTGVFSTPTGIAIDAYGAVWVTDIGNNYVWRVLMSCAQPTAPPPRARPAWCRRRRVRRPRRLLRRLCGRWWRAATPARRCRAWPRTPPATCSTCSPTSTPRSNWRRRRRRCRGSAACRRPTWWRPTRCPAACTSTTTATMPWRAPRLRAW
jgi:hypothetical protein